MPPILIGLLILSGVAATLAALIEVSHRLIADYGDCHVLVNQEKDLTVKGGRSLLATLAEHGIFIPSGCGGKGTCSLCKVRVPEGGGPVLPTETPYLHTDELTGHVRLSCQVKVRNDLKIQIPPELFMVREFRVRVEGMEALTPSIKGLRFTVLDPEEGIVFKPGQYLQLKIPRYRLSKESEYRAYSISSNPGRPRELELVITRVPEGIVSTYVHDYLRVGEELTVTGPFGEFYLRESDRRILLIATGSGLAPMLSILHRLEERKSPRETVLFFGARTRGDLYYEDRLRHFERTIPQFKLIPTLSRPEAGDHWDGEKGRVTDLIRKYLPDGPDTDVYICGSPAMVQSCLDLLGEKGVPEQRIFFDKFE